MNYLGSLSSLARLNDTRLAIRADTLRFEALETDENDFYSLSSEIKIRIGMQLWVKFQGISMRPLDPYKC
jgi:hypothetical protein